MRLVANKQRGFTLIEVIVALTMFGVIMTAVTFAVSAVLQASQRSQQRLNASTDARGLLSFLGHDLQAAFASTQNPSSIFIGNGGDGANSSIGNMGVLTLATSLHRIDAPELDDTGSSTAQPASPNGQGMSPPQSDVEMIRYDFDPETKVVSRQHSGVPNLRLLAQQTSLPETVIARNVLEFRLRFWMRRVASGDRVGISNRQIKKQKVLEQAGKATAVTTRKVTTRRQKEMICFRVR